MKNKTLQKMKKLDYQEFLTKPQITADNIARELTALADLAIKLHSDLRGLSSDTVIRGDAYSLRNRILHDSTAATLNVSDARANAKWKLKQENN